MSKCLSSRLQKMTMISSATTMAQERQTPPPLSPKFPIHFCSCGAACITSFCSCRKSSSASSNLPLLEASCSTPPGVCGWITVNIIHTSGGFHGPGHKDKLAHAYTVHAFLGGPWCELGLWIPNEIHGYMIYPILKEFFCSSSIPTSSSQNSKIPTQNVLYNNSSQQPAAGSQISCPNFFRSSSPDLFGCTGAVAGGPVSWDFLRCNVSRPPCWHMVIQRMLVQSLV